MSQVKFFKGCILQILRGPFLNTWTHLCLIYFLENNNTSTESTFNNVVREAVDICSEK